MIRFGVLTLFFVCTIFAAGARAQADDGNEGQAELDQAIELQVGAQSLSDLEKVAELCDSALKKGLNDDNQQFAKQLLSSTLYRHAMLLCGPIFEQKPPDRRWPLLRQFAVKDLDRVVEMAPELGEAHLQIARLMALPQGDRDRGMEAANKAIKLLVKDKRQLAAAYVIRAQLRDDDKDRLEDYGRAIDTDPGNAEAWQARALAFMAQGNLDKAIEDLDALLKQDDGNVIAHLALAEALTNLEKFDEAMTHVEKVTKLQPDNSLAYTLRARLHVIKEDAKSALADLDRALELNPTDLSARLIRARLHQAEGDLKAAKEDVDRVMLMSPNLPQGLLIRSMIYADDGRLGDAIADMKTLLKQDPKNMGWQMQLAGYYLQDERPTKAIEIFAQALEEDKENWIVRQARADTLLSVGKHAEAIADFEIVLKQQPEDDSILNNFAWVLATSPLDKLRDGKRAVELAQKACEVTEYKEAHILSTLAAAYAETGDFENAVKWSKKAVELGTKENEIDQQLQNELNSYLEKKPWREQQTVEEKDDPVQQRRSSFEA